MQSKKLYVGNLNYATTNEELRELFEGQGTVENVNIIEGKGFGFVEMASEEEAQKAKETLNGNEFMGRTLRVDNARPRNNNNNRGGFRRNNNNRFHRF